MKPSAGSFLWPSKWVLTRGRFLIMGMSIVVNLKRPDAGARKYQSRALEADALHFRTDIWSSGVVIIGLALVKFGEFRGGNKRFYENADVIAALRVAVLVIYVSRRRGRRAVDALLDRAPRGPGGPSFTVSRGGQRNSASFANTRGRRGQPGLCGSEHRCAGIFPLKRATG